MEAAKTNDIKLIYCTQAVRSVIKAMPEGEVFSGWELKKRCLKIRPELKNMYVETFLRSMRKVCKNSYICINRCKSQYQKIGAENE